VNSLGSQKKSLKTDRKHNDMRKVIGRRKENLFKNFVSKSKSNILILLKIEEVPGKLGSSSGLALEKKKN